MSIQEILIGGGGVLLLLMSLIQISPIKINPWSWFARTVGRAINGEVLEKLSDLDEAQQATQKKLDKHIHMDDERDADKHRERILQFNNELLRDIPHTREDFIEILTEIDYYERYCHDHPDYQNNRAVHAIANISRVYDDRLKKHDFLPC